MREWTESVRYLRDLGVEPPTAPPPTNEPTRFGSKRPGSPVGRVRRYFDGFRNRSAS